MRAVQWVVAVAALTGMAIVGQGQEAAPSPRAATVNGEAIYESAVQRAIRNVPKEGQARARQQALSFFIDNLLIDQHLVKQKVEVSKEETDARLKMLKDQATAQKQDFTKFLTEMAITEPELRALLTSELRWDKFVRTKAGDQGLLEHFKANKELFDGSQARARHILVQTNEKTDDKARAAAQAKLAAAKKQLDGLGDEAVKKLDAKADAATKEQARLKAVEDAFAAAATKDSDCPSKKMGGDLGWFPRSGSMVEPFAKATFAMQPGQLSPIVETQFGYHLILCTGRMAGKEVKFDDLKDDVRESYADKLRETLLPELRKSAKIELSQSK